MPFGRGTGRSLRWQRGARASLAAAALSLLASAGGAVPGSSLAWAKSSPGFKPDPGLNKVVPQALPPISIGTGKYPNLLVDAAGTAHLVYTEDGGSSAPDTLAVCNLQRGQKTCAQSMTAPTPVAPTSSQGGAFLGNFPGGNHDPEGAVPLAIDNELYVVERRFPDVFRTPNGATSESNVFEWSSGDGGATLTGPAIIGDNQMSGGAITFGDPSAPSIGTISRTETDGTFFQGSQPGLYAGTAKAQLGSSAQAYEGSVAPDTSGSVIRPVAAYADQSGHVYVREWSGEGNVNDISTWSAPATSTGYSPRIVGGPSGVFLLTSDSDINGGNLTLQRIVAGQPSGSPVSLGRSLSPPSISEDSTGELSFAYTDQNGVEVRTSSDGADFTPAQFVAAIPSGSSIAHLVTAATSDGGGFVSFVSNPQGAEGVGNVVAAAFGTQAATGHPGLGPLPGGGIGSAAGDQLATSTCSSAKFGVVDAEVYPRYASCYVPDPQDRNMSVTLGTVDLNGLLIVPDAGTRIGIDPKLHKIQTSGSVSVILRADGIPDVTLYHGPLGYDVPNDGAGDSLFDPYLDGSGASKLAGFPIEGNIDVELAQGGVDIPVSLALPSYLGGITGSAVLHAASFQGLSLGSLEFKVPDINVGALELKGLDVKYQSDGDVWTGGGELEVPAGGSALDLTLSCEFDDGQWTKGHIDLGLGYPGIPLAAEPPPPTLYLTHGGLDLNFQGGTTLTGTVGFGAIPIPPASGDGGPRDYLVSLDASLTAAFKSPVTLTLTGTTYLSQLQIGQEVLTWTLPDQVQFTGQAGLSLGPLDVSGQIAGVIDPHARIYSASIAASGKAFGYTIQSVKVVINQQGFGLRVVELGVPVNVVYYWGDPLPKLILGGDATTRFQTTVPAASSVRRAHALAPASFTVPRGAPTADLIAHGTGGAPAVILTAPSGQQITPGALGSGASAVAVSDATTGATYVGISHPQPGTWTVSQAPTSPAPLGEVEYATGVGSPTAQATITGHGRKRVLHYHATVPSDTAITFAEQTGHLLHVIGKATGRSGKISFTPATGPGGRRQIVALITDDGLPFANRTVSTYTAPAPARPGRARQLHVQAGRGAFTFSYTPPSGATRVLITIASTDGRHLQRVVSASTRRGSVPALGTSDGVTVTVTGIGADGARGPATSARAQRTLPTHGAKR